MNCTNNLTQFLVIFYAQCYLAHNMHALNSNNEINIIFKPILLGGLHKLGEITAKNEELYRLQMQKNKIDVDSNGVNQMKYEIVSEESIYNRHKMINVRF